MDTPKTSDLLQARLRERKAAEIVRSQKQQRSGRSSGRDDGIFDAEPQSPKANSGKLYQSSPIDITRKTTKPTSRRGSNLGSNDTTPRALGLRELEDNANKLSKENFALKLDVYHHRQKIQDLEKKVAELEADSAESIEINDALLRQVEKRDVAVDEAVVMITDLEAKVLSLQDALEQSRQTVAQLRSASRASSAESTAQTTAQSRNRSTPPSTHKKSSSRTSISPEVSARMASLAIPASPEKSARPPSFLMENRQSTTVLKSLYVRGDQAIRPLPSQASLLSRQTALEEDDVHHDVLRSPVLSAISESDLKSLYAQDQDALKWNGLTELNTEASTTPVPSVISSKQHKLARVNRWVEDSVVSSTQQTRLKRVPKAVSQSSGQFQSLGDVLHQDAHPAEKESRTTTKKARSAAGPAARAQVVSKPTPPMLMHPVFGQTYFPPTPDTMATHPLNRSTSSIVQERSNGDGSGPPSQAFNSLTPMIQPLHVVSPQARPSTITRHSILPQEVDSYGEGDFSDDANPFGHNSYNSFSDSTSQGSPLQYRHHRNMEQVAPRNSPSPELLFKSRPMAEGSMATPSQSRPRGILRVNTDPTARTKPLASPTSAFPAFSPSFYDATTMRTSLADSASLLPSSPPTANSKRGRPAQLNELSPTSPLFSPQASANTKSPPSAFMQQSNSLRERVARLGRRGSGAGVSDGNTPTHDSGVVSGPEDSRPSRRRSIKERFFQRRGSSAHEQRSNAPAAVDSHELQSLRFDTLQQQGARPPVPCHGRPQTSTSTASKASVPMSTGSNTSGQGQRFFVTSAFSSTDEVFATANTTSPTPRRATFSRGRSVHGANDAPSVYGTPSESRDARQTRRSLSRNTTSGRKRFSFSGSRVGAGIALAAAAEMRNYDGGVALANGTTGARERSESFRLRELDATAGGGRWT